MLSDREEWELGQTVSSMTPQKRVEWLNFRWPFEPSDFKVGETIFCARCDGKFKVEDVGVDLSDGLPCCPHCRATPMDFSAVRFWGNGAPRSDRQVWGTFGFGDS